MTTRKEFEKWAVKGSLDIEVATYSGHKLGFYRYLTTEAAWQAWQAAKKVYRSKKP